MADDKNNSTRSSSDERKETGKVISTADNGSELLPTVKAGEVFSLIDIDPALNAKMHLVNDVSTYPQFTDR